MRSRCEGWWTIWKFAIWETPAPNLHYALLSDMPDSEEQPNEADPLVDLAASLIEKLNLKYAPRGWRQSSRSYIAIASTTRAKACGWDGSASAASCSTSIA